MPHRILAARRTDPQFPLPGRISACLRPSSFASGRFGQLRRERLLAGVAPRMRSGAGGAAAATLPGGRAGACRRWYRRTREPLPAEPGRLVVCALLGRARRARGCRTPGDDRLETRAYAVKRYLFRVGHAARSARYATSIEQLVVGLAPVMAWGTPPRRR